jgi:hypothetical protein
MRTLMSEPDVPPPPDRRVAFLEELLDEHATIAGDIIELDAHTWAIHGSIAVDGDEILAEFDTEDQARMALDELPSFGEGTGCP